MLGIVILVYGGWVLFKAIVDWRSSRSGVVSSENVNYGTETVMGRTFAGWVWGVVKSFFVIGVIAVGVLLAISSLGESPEREARRIRRGSRY